jgi:hypothetical protein
MMTNDVGGHNENGSDNCPYQRERTLCLRIFRICGDGAPPFSPSITACHMTKVVQIAALPAIRSAWKPLQEFLWSVTTRPFGTTKLIEPISRIGNPRERSEVQIDL